jgi:hypothetical protein
MNLEFMDVASSLLSSVYMKSIIIVSKCLRVINSNSRTFYEFHFTGVFRGHLIKKIKIEGQENNMFEVGESYLIQLKDSRLIGPILEGEVVKFKRLEECCDRS